MSKCYTQYTPPPTLPYHRFHLDAQDSPASPTQSCPRLPIGSHPCLSLSSARLLVDRRQPPRVPRLPPSRLTHPGPQAPSTPHRGRALPRDPKAVRLAS